MLNKIILASKSKVRKRILEANRITNEVKPSNVDEEVVKESLIKEKASPEMISKNLAELKANKVSLKELDCLVLGADSVIDLEGELISKPESRKEALKILKNLESFTDYDKVRDFPGLNQTTLLSAHNKFGTISIRETYAQIKEVLGINHTIMGEIYWREFFNIKVPIHTGAEMLSKRFDLVVINYVTKRVKRGYYTTEFQLITDTPKDFKDYQITDLYTELTEKNILEQPEYYLWSHKRFKHRDKVPTKFQ